MIPTIIAMGNVYFFTVLKVIGITLRFRVGKINLNNLHTMHKIQFFVKNIENHQKIWSIQQKALPLHSNIAE